MVKNDNKIKKENNTHKSKCNTVRHQGISLTDAWNRLGDDDTVCAPSLNCFKHYLEKLHKDESFDSLLQYV